MQICNEVIVTATPGIVERTAQVAPTPAARTSTSAGLRMCLGVKDTFCKACIWTCDIILAPFILCAQRRSQH